MEVRPDSSVSSKRNFAAGLEPLADSGDIESARRYCSTVPDVSKRSASGLSAPEKRDVWYASPLSD
uniref:Uncharacterized protein n=1 Tax=Arachis hypogaea TaxID=3818 RepID=G0Y6W6_ARAHY|nr:unknown [Arachis hypogaea]